MDGAFIIRHPDLAIGTASDLRLIVVCAAALGVLPGCELVLGDLPAARDTAARDAAIGAGGDDAGEEPNDDAAGASGAGADAGGNGGGGGAGGDDGGPAEAGGAAGGGGCIDADGDGHPSLACGGDDCDDSDKDVHPGQTLYFTTKNANVGFDYDCDGNIVKDPNLDVAYSCPLALSACVQPKDGYLGVATSPACGDGGAWGNCAPNGLGCAQNVKDASRTMGCH